MQMQLLLINTYFFFNDTATTEIYTLSLHDALPISMIRKAKVEDWPRLLELGEQLLAKTPYRDLKLDREIGRAHV